MPYDRGDMLATLGHLLRFTLALAVPTRQRREDAFAEVARRRVDLVMAVQALANTMLAAPEGSSGRRRRRRRRSPVAVRPRKRRRRLPRVSVRSGRPRAAGRLAAFSPEAALLRAAAAALAGARLRAAVRMAPASAPASASPVALPGAAAARQPLDSLMATRRSRGHSRSGMPIAARNPYLNLNRGFNTTCIPVMNNNSLLG